MPDIDLNSDLGEGAGHDAEILALVTTANVACGAHAGDPMTALATIREAVRRGVRVGAHPGYFDREQFGRRELDVPEDQVFADCLYQIGALIALAKSVGARATHIKPHGGLYNRACRDEATARPLVEAARQFNLPILALPGSTFTSLTNDFIAEGFADRRYRPDGSLVPRSQPDAFVHDAGEAADQALRLITERGVRSLCVHGDNPQALDFIRQLRDALTARGYRIRPFA